MCSTPPLHIERGTGFGGILVVAMQRQGAKLLPELLLPVGGFRILVGADGSKVRIYYQRFIEQYYSQGDVNECELQQLRDEAIKSMLRYYGISGNVECFYATLELRDRLLKMEKRYRQIYAGSDASAGDKNLAVTYQKRQAVEYNFSLSNCFCVEGSAVGGIVEDCISRICISVAEAFGQHVHTADVAEVMCGKKRDLVLKGDALLNRIWIHHLIVHLVRDNRICMPSVESMEVWDAANQAFLKKFQEPFACDHFSKAPLRKDTASSARISSIIQDELISYGLASKK